jgi:hypothetical protein
MNILNYIPDSLPVFNLTYKMEGVDRIGRDWSVEISRQGYKVISVKSIIPYSSDPVEIQTSYADGDPFKPVFGIRARVTIVSPEYDSFFFLKSCGDREVIVTVSLSDNVIFQGYLIPDETTIQYGHMHPIVTIVASPGIGMLREKMFTIGPTNVPPNGSFLLKDLFAYLLYLAGNRNNFFDYVAYTERFADTAYNLTGHAAIPVQKYFQKPCYDLLTDILEDFRMQLIQVNNNYVIRCIDNQQVKYYDEYDYRGNLVQSVTAGGDVNKIDYYDTMKGQIGSIMQEQQYQTLAITRRKEAVKNLIFNHDFSRGMAGWQGDGPQYDRDDIYVRNGVLHIRAGSIFDGEEFTNPTNRFWVEQDVILRHSKDFFEGSLPRDDMRLRFSAQIARTNYTSYTGLTFYEVPYVQIFQFSDADAIYVDSDGNGKWQNIEFETVVSLNDIIGLTLKLHTTGADSNVITMFKNVRLQVIDSPSFSSDFLVEPLTSVTEQIDDIMLSEKRVKDLSLTLSVQSSDRPLGVYGYDHHYRTKDIADRNAETSFFQDMFSHLKDRLTNFYLTSRERQSAKSVLIADVFPTAIDHIRDKYTNRDYTILSADYLLRSAQFSRLEMLEYQSYVADPIEVDWVLAEGIWNDEGYWLDGDNWNDGFYDITIRIVDDLGNPVAGQVQVVDTEQTREADCDTNGEVQFTDVPEGNISINARSSGANPWESVGTETLNDIPAGVFEYELR